ncbi:MAG: alpha/beta hydrolase [Acidimicrobiaceae bacterium]|nr:alpha/beta hydrolase [Acidimicrobiaceae bacterium]
MPAQVRTVQMPGGRALAFAESGRPDGFPVIYHHGTPGSRLEQWPDRPTLAQLGVRLVTFDRPGCGRSDPLEGRTLLDVAADVERLADHLGLERFAVSGMSGGAPYVLATAYALRDRVNRAAISCAAGPLDRPGALEGMTPAQVEELELARNDPDRLGEFFDQLDVGASMPEEELSAFGSIPGLPEVMLLSVREATRQGWGGVIADDLCLVGPWGFPLEEVNVPVWLWHGDRDKLAPLHHASYIADRVSSAQLNICRGEGHIDMFRHQEEVLGILAGG